MSVEIRMSVGSSHPLAFAAFRLLTRSRIKSLPVTRRSTLGKLQSCRVLLSVLVVQAAVRIPVLVRASIPAHTRDSLHKDR